MGKGIKTRVSEKKGIKAIDKAAVASERMKEAYIRTKDKAEHGMYAEEGSPGEYASDRFSAGVDNVAHEAVHQFDKQGRKGVQTTKENISKVKEKIQKRKAAAEQPKKQAEKQAARQAGQPATRWSGRQAADTVSEPAKAVRQERGAIKTLDRGKKGIKAVDRSRKTIKQASSTAKGTIKTASKSIKTAEKTAKASIKTSQQAAKAAQRTAQATARAVRAAVHAARAAAIATAHAIKAAAKATAAAVKAIIAATKALIAAIAAGGWIVVLIIVVICLIGMIIGSCFGIFFSGEDSGTGQTMQTAVQEINTDYQENLDEIKASHSYDVLEMSGSRAVWKEVLAVYAVKTTTDPDNAQEVATMDDEKLELLKDIFWQMNEISSSTSTQTETVIETSDDGNGNIVETETTVTQTYLYITVSHMLILTFVTGTVVISLLLCMWTRTRQKEMAVFISMGERKIKIFLQAILESVTLFLISGMASCGLGIYAAGWLQKMLVSSSSDQISLQISLQAQDMAVLLAIGGAVVLIAVFLAVFPILKTSPREILSRMEG